MGRFSMGQTVTLISDRQTKGAVIGIEDGNSETRYRVFTNGAGIQMYYESQLEAEDESAELSYVDVARFHAELTAALIRTPSISSLYSLNAAQIDFIPHQYRPVLKFIRSDRPRLLIADGVGVGKTIEAGLILKELQARTNLNSVLIICPRPLVSEHKWETEMKRFGEEFTPLDGNMFRHCIAEMDMEGEWPDKYKKAVIPYSLFDEGNVQGNAKHPGLLGVEAPKFDLVIVDEAHHIRNTNTYAYRAVSHFCDAAEAVVFLTATPVQLQYDDLYTLLNLLRPDLVIDKATFFDMAEPNEFINHAAMAIRRKEGDWQETAYQLLVQACETAWGKKVFQQNPQVQEILQTLQKENVTQEERVQLISDVENLHTFSNLISRTRRRDIGTFTVRKPYTMEIPFTLEQKQLHDEVLAVIHQILAKVHCTDNTKFMMTTIRRQTASCLFGLVPLLGEILYRHACEIEDEDGNTEYAVWGDKKSEKVIEEKIKKILELADHLPPQDPKLDAVLEIVRNKQKEKKKKVMIFSSFRHTLRYLDEKLKESGLRVGMIDGSVVDEDRRAMRKRFDPSETPDDSENALDVLLFSEVGCEGLDYQFCDCMINYDLPWNPMRVEQRIGRIDRNGQTSESVSIYNMVTPGTVDFDIYERCLCRIGVFHNSVGDCESILGEITSEVNKVAADFTLTETERSQKLQQIMDNKIREIREQEHLEEKQRDLFGLHVPESQQNKEVEEATNHWLSAECIQELVLCYLKEKLGPEREYITGTKKLKKLRLSQEDRIVLLTELKRANFPKTEQNKAWRKLLESGEQMLDVTFDSECWKETPKAVFLSVTHPLVKLAAEELNGKGKVVTALCVHTEQVPKGTYPFAMYQWKLSGERENIRMVPISDNAALNSLLPKLLETGEPVQMPTHVDKTYWKEVEQMHHACWEKALTEHKAKTREMIGYKEASLRTSHMARMAVLEEQLKKNTGNRMYIQMTEGKKRIAQEDFDLHMRQLQEAEQKADVLFELLAYGIVTVE